MNETIQEYAEMMGIRDPELLQRFIVLRSEGRIRKEMAEDIGRSQRTLHDWEEKLIDLPRYNLSELVVAALKEEVQK